MQHAVRSLHDFDSQVAWGILTKNRSSMLRFCRVVIECIVPCLTVSYITLSGYSCTAEHPADRASRAHEDIGDQSAGQSRGDISMNSWNDYEAATKIEAINYALYELYYHLQLKGKVPVSARLLEAWSLLAALAGDAVGLHDRRFAISLLLVLHSMLRTGNLLSIRKMGFSFIQQSSCDIFMLPETKSVYASAAGTFTTSSTVELPHISFCSAVSWIAPWSEEGGHPPRHHSSTSAMPSKNALLQVSKIASWRLSSMATLHLGRLRRPSSGEKQEAVDTVRGRLEQEVSHASIGIATRRSGLQKE